jgi:tetratricopeptide (TPR) repeat protein
MPGLRHQQQGRFAGLRKVRQGRMPELVQSEATEVDQLIGDRVRRSIGEDLNRLALAGRVPACGALEGRRFTAAAVADTFGIDRDDLIDFIDEALAVDDTHPDGLLIEDGWVHVSDEVGRRSLAMYRFARKRDWVTVHKYGLTENERRDLSRRLAHALATLYGGDSYRIAQALVRLCSLAALSDRATYYRRMADTRISREMTLARARQILADEEPTDRDSRRRASQALIAAAHELFHTGPFTDGLSFAELAHRLAPLRRDQAMALYLVGVHRQHLGDHDQARNAYQAALELRRELGDRHGEAAVRHALARIDLEQGNYERARTELRAVLQLRRELGDRDGEADARHALAHIDLRQGNYERARTEFQAVLKLRRELGDRDGEADARHALAHIDLRQGNYERARTELRAVLQLRRELGDRHGEADARHALARIDLEQEN